MIPRKLVSIYFGKSGAAVMPREGWPSVSWCIEPLFLPSIEEDALLRDVRLAFEAAPLMRTAPGSTDLRQYRSPLELALPPSEYRSFLRGAILFQLGLVDDGLWSLQIYRNEGGGSFERLGEPLAVRGDDSDALVRLALTHVISSREPRAKARSRSQTK